MRTKYSDAPVDKELYQKARDEVLTKLSIPKYFTENIDGNVNLYNKPNCLCPFHEEDTPSFRYNGNENYWRCFGKCQVGGTVIELHMKQFGIRNHYEALWHLKESMGKKYGLTFKNFFLTEDNMDLSMEEILKKNKVPLSLNDFIKPKKHSLSGTMIKIEKNLTRLKNKNRDVYIEACIMYDNLHVYGIKDGDKYTELLKKITKL